MSNNTEALPPFDDPRVQAAYRVLCEDPVPPDEHHWEGYVARRIVAALAQQAATPTDPEDDDVLTVAYMAGRYDGRKAAAQQAATPAPAEPTCYVHREQLASLHSRPIDDSAIQARYGRGFPGWVPESIRSQYVPLYAAPPATPAAQPAEEVVQRLMERADEYAMAASPQVHWRNRAALESALRAALAQAVPAGFRLVPEKPTEAMVEAGASQSSLMDYKRGSRAMWAAMLAAAPSAPSAAQEKPE